MTSAPLQIFVVEDHQDTLEALEFYLTQAGHVVRSAGTKAAALSALSQAPCDLLLSDISLSDGTGWDLVRELGSARPRYTVAMSGFGTAKDIERSKTAGFRHHLVKPIDPDTLDELVADAVRERDEA